MPAGIGIRWQFCYFRNYNLKAEISYAKIKTGAECTGMVLAVYFS